MAPPGDKYPERIIFARISKTWRMFARLFLVLAEYPVRGTRGERPIRSPSRLLRLFGELLWLTKYMEREGLSNFSEWSPREVRGALREWTATPARSDCATRGFTSFVHIQGTLQRLYLLGPAHLCLLPDGLVLDPSTVTTATKLGIKVGPAKPTAEIPEACAHRTWQAAYHWLETMGPRIAAARPLDEWIRDRSNWRASGTLHASAERTLRGEKFRAIAASLVEPLPFELSAALWVRPGNGTRATTPEEWLLQRARLSLELLWNLTLAAAYIVMGLLSGFRVSEVLTVKNGGLQRKGDAWRVRTTVWKTSSKDRGVETDRPVPLGFVEAHRVLVAMAHSKGRTSDSDPVFVTFQGIVPSGSRINEMVNQFAGLHGIEWDFKSHQFRKFFALFYVRRFKGPLDALRYHFRHRSREMLENYIKDALNARYMAEAEAEVAEEIFATIIHGGGDYAMPPPVSRYAGFAERYAARNLPLKEVEVALRKAEHKPGLRVVAMEWGYCICGAGGAEVAACRGNHGEPARDLAVPSDCFACPLLVVGQENEARIRQSLAFHQDVLDSAEAAPRAKRHSTLIVERMESALMGLGGAKNSGRASGEAKSK